MKKQNLLFLLLTLFICFSANSQTVTFNEYFDYNTGYCDGDPQYDNWVSFRAGLDTSSLRFMKITMRGTYDMTGKSCTDKYAVRQICDALYNGYDATINCNGVNWTVGTGCSDYNCGNYSDYIELTLNQYTCNCGPSYTIRPGMTSPNWGGINTETCQWWYQNANQDMIAEAEYIYYNRDLTVTNFAKPDECTNSQSLKATIQNLSLGSISTYNVGYSINGTNQTPLSISTSIASEATVDVTLTSSYTFSPGTTYQIKVWTYNPNGSSDERISNDTFYFNYKHAGSPNVPTANNVVNCGQGSVKLSASGAASDSLIWYANPTGGSILKIGKNYQTPFLTRTDTFYVEAATFKSIPQSFSTPFNNYAYLSGSDGAHNGNFINITAYDLLQIKGFKVQPFFGYTTADYIVYIKEGTYVGNETNPAAWTKIYDNTIPATGSRNYIPVDFTPEMGKLYGVYITTNPTNNPSEDQWATYGNSTYTGSDLRISGGAYAYGLFGSYGISSPYTLDVEVDYVKTCKSSSRKAIEVKINPKPYGSEYTKGNTFEGQYRIGDITTPDITEVGNDIEYLITPPIGYSNSSYSTSWTYSNINLSHLSGAAFDNSSFTFAPNTATTNGLLKITPVQSSLDEVIVAKFTIADLGPYFCDTVITRYIKVAPTPKVKFAFPTTICDGDGIVFENLSSIYSGNLSFKWKFGDGDSSDNLQPVKVYSNPGTYFVQLIATSSPWNIVNDTTMEVTVNEIPEVNFKAINACDGLANRFINQTTIGNGVLTYTWDFGDNTPTSSVTNPSHTYLVPKGYPVTLTASASGCNASLTKNAYLFARPDAQFSVPSSAVCGNVKAQFTNNSTISQGEMGSLWNFVGSNISTLDNPSYEFGDPGTYNVKLKMVSEFGCEDSIIKPITIKQAPTADFSGNIFCANETTTFNNLTAEYSGITTDYTWTVSEGAGATTKNLTKTWNNIGPKTVTLKAVQTNGCENTITKEFEVLNQANSDFTVQDICSGENAKFVNRSSASQGVIMYNWDFGDLTPNSNSVNPIHVYTTASTSTFTVKLISSMLGGCNDTISKIINVTEIPNCNFTLESVFIPGKFGYKFKPAVTGLTSYEWYFGDGGTSNLSSPLYEYTSPGVYHTKLMAKNNGGCLCQQEFILTVNRSNINSIEDNGIELYPNPTNDFFTLNLKSNVNTSLKITNAIGQEVLSQNIEGLTSTIDVSSLSSGIYTVVINNNGIISQTKLVINQ
jgi:PKD repeat protein